MQACPEKVTQGDLPNLWKPRPDQFFHIDALPCLGTVKLDLRKAREIAAARSLERKFLVLTLVILVVRSSFATLWPRVLELLPSGYDASGVAELFRHLDLSQLQQPFDLLAALGH